MKRNLLGKAMALLTTFCLVVSISPLSAFAAEPETVSSWEVLQEKLTNSGNITLDNDIIAPTENHTALAVPYGTEVVLDLNGHTLNRNLTEGTYQGYVIRVYGTLTVQDSSEAKTGMITGGYNGKDNKGDSAGGGIYVDLNGTLNFNGGTISGNKAYSGGGVYVGGTMNMNGGKITGNEATAANSDGGGGVKVEAGKFYMTGGEISNNKAPRYGAGVSVWRASGKQGYFEMSGGMVSNNTITANAVTDGSDIGGGIYVKSGNIVLNGGNISSNSADQGAGIYLKGESGDKWDSTLTMNSAEISGNTAASSGGGIYVGNYSTLTLQSGNINQNESACSGGGIYFDSQSHGEITGGSINRNAITADANHGAGISASDDVKISGSPRIETNYNANSYIDNVYLPFDSSVLKVSGALGDNAYIGIANGGTNRNHYAAVGSSEYAITENDRSKIVSDTANYAVKPLNTAITGNRVELGESWPIVLMSDHVTVSAENTAEGKVTLKENTRAKAWKDEAFVFTVEPAEGYAKTDAFSVAYKVNNGNKTTLSPDENGSYTIPAQNKRTELYIEGLEQQFTVTFEANGGSSADTQKMFTGGKVTRPTDPAREGYTFAGWYADESLETSWDFESTVTKDTTLYAKWTAIPYTVDGAVTGRTDEDMTGTIVKLMQDSEVVKEITVDNAAGHFSFSDVTIGNYSIFAEKDDRRASVAITVKADAEHIAMKLPDSNIETAVKVDENTPKTTVIGLEELAEDSQYTPSGAEVVRIVFNVAAKEESAVPTETVSAIKALSSNEILTYLDMDITRYVNEVQQGKITDTGAHVQAITIHFDTARRNISVYRVHEGNAIALTAAGSTPADGTFRVNDGSITIYATKFSTYAIGYTTKSSGGHSASGSSASSTAAVEIKSAANGTVKTDKSSAAKGSTVTITVTPDKGYALDKLTVLDQSGKQIELTEKNGKYTFTMPAGKVTVTASFAEAEGRWDLAYRDCPQDSTCPIWPYTDARTTDWYHDGVHFCLENGLMVGYGSNIFQPDSGTTRAMIAVMLWRRNGSPVVNYAMDFHDVQPDAWYTEAVRWAVSQGVAQGYGNGSFGPDDTLSREQMVTILWRYAQYKDSDVSVGENTNILSYDDAAAVAQYAIPAMQWACGSGIVTGKTQGSGMILDPQGSTTRAQMATMMMRFCAEIVE